MLMEECMRECMRKLALWNTRNFKPVMAHDELEPIMATLGFVPLPLPPSADWREYYYCGSAAVAAPAPDQPPPSPRLPYPRIDGLHLHTYSAFLDALNFHLCRPDISDIFHIRGMPLHKVHDRSKKWRRIEEDDSVFVYREGTLDQAACAHYQKNKNENSSGIKRNNSMLIRSKGNNMPKALVVPLTDIIGR
ncbi:uncharacterized protein LOC127801051 [Diospyros lotus]|uniref:uncharacterized protein LOC127801051 n=1 Tax=Diospyros lotus TaxID=55363 RepID=UPI00224F0B66|nr:uncharacterized protein LOC127801051 [Diospyros lotus]